MARRRSGSFQGSHAGRRGKGWEEGPGGSAVTTFTASTQAILTNGAQFLQDGLTVLRLRGSLQAFLVSANAAGDGFHCAIGIGIVSENAFGIGITAVPTPLGDTSWDGWLYFKFFDVHGGFLTAGDVQHLDATFEVDSKAMRKVKDTDVLFAVVETIEIGTAEMDVFFESRILLALP